MKNRPSWKFFSIPTVLIIFLFGGLGPLFSSSTKKSAKAEKGLRILDWKKSSEGADEYLGKEVLIIPWGEGKGQFPNYSSKDRPFSGSNFGEFKRLHCECSLKVCPDGNFIIGFAGKKKLAYRKIDRAGKTIFETGHLNIHLGNQINFGDKGEINIFDNQSKTFVEYEKNGELIRKERQQDPEFDSRWRKFGEGRKRGIEKNNEQKTVLTDVQSNKALVYFPEEIKEGNQIVIKIIGQDNADSVYVLARLIRYWPVGKPQEFVVYKFSKEGALLAKIFSKVSDFAIIDSPENTFDVDRDGNIYQLFNSEKGLGICEWSK